MEPKLRLFSPTVQAAFSEYYCLEFSNSFFSFSHSYPSGNLAISISEVARTMLLYTAFTDESTISAKQIAQFDPFGNGYCNFTNGDLRYIILWLYEYKNESIYFRIDYN